MVGKRKGYRRINKARASPTVNGMVRMDNRVVNETVATERWVSWLNFAENMVHIAATGAAAAITAARAIIGSIPRHSIKAPMVSSGTTTSRSAIARWAVGQRSAAASFAFPR